MRVVSHNPLPERSPDSDGDGCAGRRALKVLDAELEALRRQIFDFVKLNASGASDEVAGAATKLLDSYLGAQAALTAVMDVIYREPQEQFAHGLAVGLWHAGKPGLIREFPEPVTKHLWNLPYSFRPELLKLVHGR